MSEWKAPDADAEYWEETHREFDAAMMEAGAVLLARGSRSHNVSVNAELVDDGDTKLYMEDIQEYFGCGRTSAYKILKELPSKRVGGRVFVYKRDLKKYLDERNGIYTGDKYRRRKR